MTTYRRRDKNDRWHWCTNCTNYPKSDYEEITVAGRPSYGDLCNECKGKEKAEDCGK